MAKKKGGKLKVVAKVLLVAVTLVLALALFFSFLAKLLPPSLSEVVAYCGLLFPYLLVGNLALTIVWLVWDYTWALVPALVILLNINNIDRHFQFRGIDKPDVCVSCLKVMSYNARAFNIYNPDQKSMNKQFTDFISREMPDILCVQEYSYDESGKTGFQSTQAIIEAMRVKDNDRTHKEMLPYKNKLGYQFGLAVFSRYRIVGGGYVDTEDESSNKSMYVDIKFNSDTLRVYNIHLASMHLESSDYAAGKAMLSGVYDSTTNNNAQNLFRKISAAYELRQKQARLIHRHIKESPYPVVVCGDFNDSPASYSYNKIVGGLKDSFRSSGKGTGTTYAGRDLPSFRIDYIAHDKQFNDFQHTVCRDLDVSDHYPVYTYISFVKKN
ncbi:MAG: endonuclease/exonuclease/phosphatase family protein [Bacteroidales bacterium]|nr:endonuclease/exonuclease/phosphatase family protein [Bacteroidales bacterium]